jgi:hypothetical protein
MNCRIAHWFRCLEVLDMYPHVPSYFLSALAIYLLSMLREPSVSAMACLCPYCILQYLPDITAPL